MSTTMRPYVTMLCDGMSIGCMKVMVLVPCMFHYGILVDRQPSSLTKDWCHIGSTDEEIICLYSKVRPVSGQVTAEAYETGIFAFRGGWIRKGTLWDSRICAWEVWVTPCVAQAQGTLLDGAVVGVIAGDWQCDGSRWNIVAKVCKAWSCKSV